MGVDCISHFSITFTYLRKIIINALSARKNYQNVIRKITKIFIWIFILPKALKQNNLSVARQQLIKGEL